MKFEKYLEQALQKRKAFIATLKNEGTDCFRLFSGEGISGLVVEQYGPVIIMQKTADEAQFSQEEWIQMAEWYQREMRVETVYGKIFLQDRSKATSIEKGEFPLAGIKGRESFPVTENHLKFEIRPFDGMMTGLFLDQRENRKYLSSIANKKRVLNAFAYTCAFSVYMAKSGAKVTSVDLSKKYLEWGKKNFELNEIGHEKHSFYAFDYFEFLKRAKKKGEKFDLIILDPPSFSRSKTGSSFSVKKDTEKILNLSLEVLEEGGLIFYSTNYQSWTQDEFEKEVIKALPQNSNIKMIPCQQKDIALDLNPIKNLLIKII